MAESAYQQYKHKAKQLDTLREDFKDSYHIVFTLSLKNGQQVIFNKDEGTFKIVEAYR